MKINHRSCYRNLSNCEVARKKKILLTFLDTPLFRALTQSLIHRLRNAWLVMCLLRWNVPSSHEVFFGSVVLNGTLWRRCLSPATNVKSHLPTLSIGYCDKEKDNTGYSRISKMQPQPLLSNFGYKEMKITWCTTEPFIPATNAVIWKFFFSRENL